MLFHKRSRTRKGDRQPRSWKLVFPWVKVKFEELAGGENVRVDITVPDRQEIFSFPSFTSRGLMVSPFYFGVWCRYDFRIPTDVFADVPRSNAVANVLSVGSDIARDVLTSSWRKVVEGELKRRGEGLKLKLEALLKEVVDVVNGRLKSKGLRPLNSYLLPARLSFYQYVVTPEEVSLDEVVMSCVVCAELSVNVCVRVGGGNVESKFRDWEVGMTEFYREVRGRESSFVSLLDELKGLLLSEDVHRIWVEALLREILWVVMVVGGMSWREMGDRVTKWAPKCRVDAVLTDESVDWLTGQPAYGRGGAVTYLYRGVDEYTFEIPISIFREVFEPLLERGDEMGVMRSLLVYLEVSPFLDERRRKEILEGVAPFVARVFNLGGE